mgnify:CR=1 FL=1
MGFYSLVSLKGLKMAFNDIERKRAEKALSTFVERRRPPPHIRSELDLGFRVHGQSVAKATYVKTQQVWKVYWQRADMKWHGYPPSPEVGSLEEFLTLVDKDEHYCFFG